MADYPKLIEVKTEPPEIVMEFSELYSNIIVNMYSLKSSEFLHRVKEAMKDIRRIQYDINMCYKKIHVNLNFDNPAVRCAYMYSYSVIDTTIQYSEFLKYLKRNEDLFLKLFSEKTLKICCLAGGSATEAVAISKAISDFIGKYSKEDKNLCIDVHVTVVDICSEWKYEEETVLNALNNSPKLFDSKRMHFTADFHKADLLQPFEDSLKEKIRESNIITIVKFASYILHDNSKNFFFPLQRMMKNVVECMQEDSCLFILDTAGGMTFDSLKKVISNHQSSFELQDSLHKRYRLHPKIMQKMESAMNFRGLERTATLFPTQLSRVSSCIWIKNTAQEKKIQQGKSSCKLNPDLQNPKSRSNNVRPFDPFLPTFSRARLCKLEPTSTLDAESD